MSETTVRTRFAPSPTGEVHLGNLRTALFSYLYAAGRGGVFLLRIEDTDTERSRAEHAAALMRDLRWLGLNWQEGPEAGGEQGPYFQSQRMAQYEHHYQALDAAGMTYPCFCSDAQLKLARKAQRAAGKPPRYPGTCAHLSAEEVARKREAGGRPTVRFRVPAGVPVTFDDLVRGPQRFNSDDIGDFIIRRSDGTPAFFFSNAVDDALMGVTHVLRGEDHLTNTPRQLMILQALGLDAPAYGHLSLLVGEDGSPLSKRHGSRSVRELREAGYLPEAVLNYLARLGHSYSDDAFAALPDLAAGFALERLGRAPARFDESQLRHWQKTAVAAASTETLLAWYRASGVHNAAVGADEARLGALLDLVRDNIETPADVSAWVERLYGEPTIGETERELLCAAGRGFFETALSVLAERPDGFRVFASAVGRQTGAKGKALFMPLRIALSGVMHGPEMARVWDWLGGDACRVRLQAARDFCEGVGSDAETV